MGDQLERDFPLFPLNLVALPSEVVPLHIFEERFKTMVDTCLREESEFGIVWLSDDELKPVGCACSIEQVLERLPDGRLNILVRGTRVFRLIERQGGLQYPAGTVEFLPEREEDLDEEVASNARLAYAALVHAATDESPDQEQLAETSAYEMAATVDFGLDAKQGLLELRSENGRMRLVTRLFRAALKRLEYVDRAQARAASNGKVRFG